MHGVIFVLEMAAGQMWRFVLDGWGVSGLGLAAAIFVIFRRGVRDEVRIMAALATGVTLVTAVISPAALPPTQPQAWASGRYLDGMVVAFFMVGAVVLLRAAPRRLALGAACVAAPTVLAAIVVVAYAGGSVPTSGFGAAFVFAEVAVLTQGWTTGSVLLATAVALGLLAAAVVVAAVGFPGRSFPGGGFPGGPALAGRPGRRARGGQPGRVGPDDQPHLPALARPARSATPPPW